MSYNVALKCQCGKLTGSLKNVSSSRGTHLICYCDDCQKFAIALNREDTVLDDLGGTEIFQSNPANLSFETGQDHLCCLRLTPKGLMRWYAGCCNTPIANTLPTPKVPFVGVIHTIFDFEDEREKKKVLGKISARIQSRFARGKPPKNAHTRAPLRVILKAVFCLGLAWFRKENGVSPFFDGEGKPVVTPRVLELGERLAVPT